VVWETLIVLYTLERAIEIIGNNREKESLNNNLVNFLYLMPRVKITYKSVALLLFGLEIAKAYLFHYLPFSFTSCK